MLESIILDWAARHHITIQAVPLFPHAEAAAESPGFGERLADALGDLKDQIKALVETLTTFGSPETIQVELSLQGIETSVERSGFRFAWTIGWEGQMGGKVSTRVFNGELSLSLNSDWIAPEQNPSYSVTLRFGPTEPNYSRLEEVFRNAGKDLTEYIRGLAGSASGVSDQEVSEVASRITNAADQVEAMTSEEDLPVLTFDLQLGSGRTSLIPTEEIPDPSPLGIYGQLVITLHF